MSISFVKELAGSGQRNDGEVTLTRNLLFHVTDGTNPAGIIFDSEIPADGKQHPDYVGYYVNSVSSPQRASGTSHDGAYIVTVNYAPASYVPTNLKQKDSSLKPWEQGARNVSYDSIDVVVPQTKYYQSGDNQFYPTGAMIHPATGEPLTSDTKETHNIINFTYSLKSFKYEWLRKYRRTTNNEQITLLGNPFPAQNLLMTKFAVSKKTLSEDESTTYYDLSMQFEDYGYIITKEIALMGYLCIYDSKIQPIQLKDNTFGWFDDPSLNIPTPRYVSTSGVVLPSGGTVGDDHYMETPDVFEQDWTLLSLPKEES